MIESFFGNKKSIMAYNNQAYYAHNTGVNLQIGSGYAPPPPPGAGLFIKRKK